jgi:hypothetical protein
VVGRSTGSLGSIDVINQQLLNSIGLALGMIGVGIIFKFGPPQPNLEPGVGVGLEDQTPLPDGSTVAEHDREIEKLRRRHLFWSRTGLGLVFFGFTFQLWATWC